MKRIILSLLLCLVSCAFFAPLTARAQGIIVENNQVYDAGYELTIQNSNITKFEVLGRTLVEAEYTDGKRTYKKGNSESVFEYDGALLTSEVRDGKLIIYHNEYDYTSATNKYIGFSINGNSFDYIYDDDGLIVGIVDEFGNLIARYVYTGNAISEIYVYESGTLTSNDESESIGVYNKIRAYGYYYDDETDLYYSNGLYENLTVGKVVGLVENDDCLVACNPFAGETEEGIMLLGYEEQDLEAELWADELLNNSTFNGSRTSGYYLENTTTTVEIIARLIYGENNKRTLDQRAIAWVILNRYNHHPNRFGNSIRSIVANSIQFNGVDSALGRQAKSANDFYWRHAVYLACLILTDNSESCWNSISPKPIGITNQVYFRAASRIGDHSQIFESNNILYAHYRSGDVAITNACIAGKGTATSENGLRQLCTGSIGDYNVFFYHP